MNFNFLFFGYKEVWNAVYSYETATQGRRRHIVTYQDMTPVGYNPYEPLLCMTHEGWSVSVKTGYIDENDEAVMLIGVNSDRIDKNTTNASNAPSIAVDGELSAFMKVDHDGSYLKEAYENYYGAISSIYIDRQGKMLQYKISCGEKATREIVFQATEPYFVNYLEIIVDNK